MKYSYQLAIILLFAVFSITGHAEETKAGSAMPMPMKEMGMGMHHGMGGMMAGMTEEEKDKHMRSMQEHMLKMHDLSNKILAEKDPAKQEQLKTEQLQLMKAHHTEMMGRHHPMQEPPKK